MSLNILANSIIFLLKIIKLISDYNLMIFWCTILYLTKIKCQTQLKNIKHETELYP